MVLDKILESKKLQVYQIHKNILECKRLLKILRLRALYQFYRRRDDGTFLHPSISCDAFKPPEYRMEDEEVELDPIIRTRFAIVIGNTSKYLSSDVRSGIDLYKWICYLRVLDVPFQKMIKKVQFILHPSYKPNDVVHLHEPPYQLQRKGWGDGFPIRALIFLNEQGQTFSTRPIQVFHKLQLRSTTFRESTAKETIIHITIRNGVVSQNILKGRSQRRQNDAVKDTELNALLLWWTKEHSLDNLGHLPPWKRSCVEWWNAKTIRLYLNKYHRLQAFELSTKDIVLLLRDVRNKGTPT